MWNRPKEVEQRKDQQYFSVLSKKMGVALDVEKAFDVEQPKDVEQAQRCGTGPKMWNRAKISNTFQCFKRKLVWTKMWNKPKDMEQAQRGRTEERSAILSSAFKKNGGRPRCGTSL